MYKQLIIKGVYMDHYEPYFLGTWIDTDGKIEAEYYGVYENDNDIAEDWVAAFRGKEDARFWADEMTYNLICGD